MTKEIGTQKQVFIDWDLIEPGYGVAWGGGPYSWEMPYGVQLSVHLPKLEDDPIIWPEYPWETRILGYTTIFEDEGRFRLYYTCYYVPDGKFIEDEEALLAYAESTDGVHWEKPKVGLVEFMGSRENNLVYGLNVALGRGAHGACVFKDPSAPAEQRYKLVHVGRDERGIISVFGAVSPDGLRWQALKHPIIPGYMSDTQTVVRYDERKGRYVGYFRGWAGLERNSKHQGRSRWHGRRTIAYAESDRFDSWPVPETLVAPDVLDSADTDIYTNAYTPWPGAPQAHLMFPAMYHRAQDILDVHLMVSRDGIHWQRPSRAPIIPSGEPGTPSEGGVYAGCGIIRTASGDWALIYNPIWHTHNQLHFQSPVESAHQYPDYVCRALWREDGIMSLEAPTEGKCTTVPLIFSGRALQVNAWTRYGGEIRVELVDATNEAMSFGEIVTGRSFEDCDPISGDAPRHVVTWRGDPDLSTLIGRPIRLRLWMRRARLYAFRFI